MVEYSLKNFGCNTYVYTLRAKKRYYETIQSVKMVCYGYDNFKV